MVEKDRIVDGRSIVPGDAILGIASSGPHSNGYSLIRKILERAGPAPFDLLEPTRIYVKPVLEAPRNGSGERPRPYHRRRPRRQRARVLPENTVATIRKDAWPRPPVFQWLQQAGAVAEDEMWRVFNCGIGMVLIVAPRTPGRPRPPPRLGRDRLRDRDGREGLGCAEALVV